MSLSQEAIKELEDLAYRAGTSEPLDYDTPYLVRDADGTTRVIITPQNPDAKPAYKTATHMVTDVTSFTAYLEKHGVYGETEIQVHEANTEITAIIDAGNAGEPGRCEHHITLNPPVDPDWTAWVRIDGMLNDQEGFAEFIENHTQNIRTPDAATMLEIAESMHVNTSVEFEQGVRTQDGQVRIGYRETSQSKAGANGDLEIPATIELQLAPFKNGPTYKVEARLRWRIRNKQLSIGVKLNRPDLVMDAAFAAIVERVEAWNTPEEDHPTYLITRH